MPFHCKRVKEILTIIFKCLKNSFFGYNLVFIIQIEVLELRLKTLFIY